MLNAAQWDKLSAGDRLVLDYGGFTELREYWVLIRSENDCWLAVDAVDGFTGILSIKDDLRILERGTDLKIEEGF